MPPETVPSTVITETPQVLLLVETSRAYGRACLAGIAAYLRAHGPWHVLHLERGLQERVPEMVMNQSFDGVIARIENETIGQTIANLGVPTVDLRGVILPPGGAMFDTDPHACAKMALEHFVERGFRHVGFCGYPGINFSDQRRDAFEALSTEANLDFQSWEVPAPSIRCDDTPDTDPIADTLLMEQAGELDEDKLAAWLAGVPKPFGILACNDIRGRQVLNAVRKANLKVPDQVAVLGVDDDEVICELASPPLSSIEPNAYRIGFEGAEALASLMAGKPLDFQSRLIPPLRVSSRRSTDVIAIDDAEIVAALEFIRSNAHSSIGVDDVAAATTISRATLERRFRDQIGRSPREEIERVRINRIRLLLVETNYNLDQIAKDTGYKTAAHVVTVFRRIIGCTPGQYRGRYRTSR